MSMCPNIWVQCLKVKLEDKRHNLKIIIFWGHIYYLDIDTKYWTQGVILAQLLFVPKKRIRQMSTYMSVPRAILMTSFFSYIFYLIYTSINTYNITHNYKHTHTHKISYLSFSFYQELVFVIRNVHFERYYLISFLVATKHEQIKIFKVEM